MVKYFLYYFPFVLSFMGAKYSPEIKSNFGMYSTLVKERKAIKENPVTISQIKKSNIHFLESQAAIVKHCILVEEIFFVTEVRILNYKDYHFSLRCPSLSQTPFFRYDSEGAPHRNNDEGIPLKEQMVETPHFNCFNSEGENIAYQTELQKDKINAKKLEDISQGVIHFFDESNTRLNENDYPLISILPGTLQIPITKSNPLEGVNFI